MKLIAQIFSVLFHPLLAPIFLVLYMLYGDTPWSFLPSPYKTATITSIGLGLSVMPVTIIGALIAIKVVKDVEMKSKSDRLIPVAMTCLSAWFEFYLTHSSMQMPVPMLRLVESFTLCTTAATIITFFWKISLHGICAGAMLVYICILGTMSQIDFGTPLVVIICISGVLCWARLYLQSHTPMQVLVGFLVGVASTLASMLF